MKPFEFLARHRIAANCALAAACWFRTCPALADTSPPPAAETGTASYYADKYHGRPTASGELFDMRQLTAAHPHLKFGTVVKVTNTQNHRTVLVRINDRGPFVRGRVIDLSLAAAEELQMIRRGLASVKLDVLTK